MQNVNKTFPHNPKENKKSSHFNLAIYDSIKHIDKNQYNRITDRENPFLEYEFLEALEISGCVGNDTSWIPRHIVLSDDKKIIGALTFYVRFDSYGEYIFDWEWAQAFENAGLQYFPKVVVAIPFTPANGTRILVDPDYSFEEIVLVMVNCLIEFCKKEHISSIHFLFLTEKEQRFLEKLGFLTRKTHQYHWKNREYECFDDFLDDMRSNRKKQIRKERRQLRELGLNISIIEKEDIKRQHMDAIWEFYLHTTSRKWGRPYLNRQFFNLMFENFRHRLVLVLAKDEDKFVGGTFNVVKNKTLFGRYWGSIRDYKNLHFECCYYKLIDYSIANKIEIFEAGAQGEHKFLRGFVAVPTYSSHFIINREANEAIKKYLINERNYTTRLINDYNRISPLKYLHEQI